ncbi:MAG: prepilin peptidase [bacterium]|nr:prepilin peptidase [bacterium]
MNIITVLSYVYTGLSGAVFGSFFNMLIHRIPLEEDIVVKRSYCPACKHKLYFMDLIPLLSYIFLLGKCRHCKEKISIRYFICELLSTVLILICWHLLGFSFIFFKTYFFLACMLVVLFIDIEHHIIPDVISLPLIIIGAAVSVYEKVIIDAIYGLVTGFSVFFIIGLLAKLYYKKTALGFGDIKLISAIGLYWGLKITVLTTYFSFIFGGAAGLFMILTGLRKKTDYIAFGPAIIAALVFSISFGNKIWIMYFG